MGEHARREEDERDDEAVKREEAPLVVMRQAPREAAQRMLLREKQHRGVVPQVEEAKRVVVDDLREAAHPLPDRVREVPATAAIGEQRKLHDVTGTDWMALPKRSDMVQRDRK